MGSITNALVISVVPLLLAGIATIVVTMFDIKACMGRLEERVKNHIEYHEILANKPRRR